MTGGQLPKHRVFRSAGSCSLKNFRGTAFIFIAKKAAEFDNKNVIQERRFLQ